MDYDGATTLLSLHFKVNKSQVEEALNNSSVLKGDNLQNAEISLENMLTTQIPGQGVTPIAMYHLKTRWIDTIIYNYLSTNNGASQMKVGTVPALKIYSPVDLDSNFRE